MLENLQFRNPNIARCISKKIARLMSNLGHIKICHVCGTHEWVITHFGLRELIPEKLEVIAGPGCPICIIPSYEIDEVIQLAFNGVTITCFGDVLRVPGSNISLLDSKAKGTDVRIVYSISDAVKMAKKERDKEFVFFAVGFETTAPTTAAEILGKTPSNLSFLIAHRLIPPAMNLLVEMKDLQLDGFIAPGHVSAIIGLDPYKVFPEKYEMPTVIAGFEPLDVLYAMYMILKQLSENKPRLENEYTRIVTRQGNLKAKKLMNKVFWVADANWRGLGCISSSKYSLREEFGDIDANLRYEVKIEKGIDLQPGCKCHLVIVGRIKPMECPLFMKKCTPQNPVGACMVSSEGTCRIWSRIQKQ